MSWREANFENSRIRHNAADIASFCRAVVERQGAIAATEEDTANSFHCPRMTVEGDIVHMPSPADADIKYECLVSHTSTNFNDPLTTNVIHKRRLWRRYYDWESATSSTEWAASTDYDSNLDGINVYPAASEFLEIHGHPKFQDIFRAIQTEALLLLTFNADHITAGVRFVGFMDADKSEDLWTITALETEIDKGVFPDDPDIRQGDDWERLRLLFDNLIFVKITEYPNNRTADPEDSGESTTELFWNSSTAQKEAAREEAWDNAPGTGSAIGHSSPTIIDGDATWQTAFDDASYTLQPGDAGYPGTVYYPKWYFAGKRSVSEELIFPTNKYESVYSASAQITKRQARYIYEAGANTIGYYAKSGAVIYNTLSATDESVDEWLDSNIVSVSVDTNIVLEISTTEPSDWDVDYINRGWAWAVQFWFDLSVGNGVSDQR